MLEVIAWVRHLYKDDVKDAPWLSDAQKASYRPYKKGETFGDKPAGQCSADVAKMNQP
jgi:cytochrome c-L